MKILLTFLFLITFMAGGVVAADNIQQFKDFPECKDKGCFVVAVKEPWKEISDTQGMKVKSGPFVLTVPSKVIWVGLGGTVTVFRYDKSAPISIGTETKDTFQLSSNDISLSQALEVLFTKTPKEYKASDKYEKELFNRLMIIKKGLLVKSDKIFIYKKGELTVYYIPKAGEPYNNIAWVVDAKNKNFALRIESNVNEDIFKNLLFAVKTKEK